MFVLSFCAKHGTFFHAAHSFIVSVLNACWTHSTTPSPPHRLHDEAQLHKVFVCKLMCTRLVRERCLVYVVSFCGSLRDPCASGRVRDLWQTQKICASALCAFYGHFNCEVMQEHAYQLEWMRERERDRKHRRVFVV